MHWELQTTTPLMPQYPIQAPMQPPVATVYSMPSVSPVPDMQLKSAFDRTNRDIQNTMSDAKQTLAKTSQGIQSTINNVGQKAKQTLAKTGHDIQSTLNNA